MKKGGLRPVAVSAAVAFVLAAGLVGCAGQSSKPAPTGAVSFAGKTVTVVVAYSPGGGTDIAGRVYSQFLAKHLPGKPTVVVRNMPGGETTMARARRSWATTITCFPT